MARPVGLALFYYTLNTFKLRPNIFLEDLFVDPAYRGSGIGLALMRHLAQRAVAEGCGRLEWRVLKWNQPSIDFYRRLGAERIDDWHTKQLSGDALVALAKGTFPWLSKPSTSSSSAAVLAAMSRPYGQPNWG